MRIRLLWEAVGWPLARLARRFPAFPEGDNMPLFSIRNKRLQPVSQSNFPGEKSLQNIVESNLKIIFNCRFVASEFPTGPLHGGRVDTLAISPILSVASLMPIWAAALSNNESPEEARANAAGSGHSSHVNLGKEPYFYLPLPRAIRPT